MSPQPLVSAREAFAILFYPAHAWRRSLFLARKQIDFATKKGSEPPLSAHHRLTHLLSTSRTQPDALLATVRQLRRVGRLDEGLAVTDELWNNGAPSSARVSLICAQVWYDNTQQRRGDVALEHAKELDPQLRDIFVEEAHNQRWRGNASAAVGAAESILKLTASPAERVYWKIFLGEMKFELGQFAAAAEIMRKHFPRRPTERQRYHFALALERSGSAHEAAQQFALLARSGENTNPLAIAQIHWKHKNYSAVVQALASHADRTESALLLSQALLFLGDSQQALSVLQTSEPSPEVREYTALAYEINGDSARAASLYAQLLGESASSLHDEPLALRALRSLYFSGDFSAMVELALRFPCSPNTLEQLTDSIPERLQDYFRTARQTLSRNGAADPTLLPTLRTLANSATTRAQVLIFHRFLGEAEAHNGNIQAAAHSLFISLPFRLPHAEELTLSPAPLTLSEFYTELWETLPLQRETILYESFHGASTSCNPLALCLELLKRDTAQSLTHIWVITPDTTIYPELLEHKNVFFVHRETNGYYVHLASAGTLINNTTFPPRFIRRTEQHYINTWHGTPWKHLGSDISDAPFAHENAGRNFLQATLTVLPNSHTARIISESHEISHLLEQAPIVTGSPRVDRTLHLPPQRAEQIRAQLHITADFPVVFYAPTWRGALGALELNPTPFLDAITTLCTRHETTILVRLHHLLARAIDPANLPDNAILVPDDIDTNEVLALTDVLVSDYSSLIFDFAPLGKPIISYAFDMENYLSERGLYFPITDIPAQLCTTPESLAEAIDSALTKTDTPQIDWSSCATAALWETEDGHATDRVLALFDLKTPPTPPEKTAHRALVNVSGLRANGITRSLRNLLSTLPESEHHVQVMVPKIALNADEAQIIVNDLHQHSNISLFTGVLTGTRQEMIVWNGFYDLRSPSPASILPWLQYRMQRERKRYFSDVIFDSVIDFDGYLVTQSALIALGFPTQTRRVYVAHSEFCEEMRTRFPRHRQIAMLLNCFTDIASVSSGAMKKNAAQLAAEFQVAPDLHRTLPNTLNIEAILRDSVQPLDDDIAAWLSSDTYHIVVAARLSIEKNHSTVLRALAHLPSECPPISLLFLGDGPTKNALRSQAQELEIDHLVFFAGHRNNPYPAIAASDALLLPSLHEGQGLVLYEAMLLGIPVAAARSTGASSVLHDSQYGLLVDSDTAGITSALIKLSNGEVRISPLDVNEYQRQALDAFFSLLSSPGGNTLNPSSESR